MLLECRGLDFSLRGLGFNAVFGPSGGGKISLARIVAGENTPLI